MKIFWTSSLVLCLALLLVTVRSGVAQESADIPDLPRFAVPMPDLSKPAAGYPILEEVEHFSVFHATEDVGMYSHHPQIGYLDGMFYASWSNHKLGEDLPGQRVLAAFSKDGQEWGKFFELFPSQSPVALDRKSGGRVLTALAWVPVDGQMYAVALMNGHGRLARNVSPEGELGPIFWLEENPPEPLLGFDVYPSATDSCFSKVAKQINGVLLRPTRLPNWGFHYDDVKLKKFGFQGRSVDGTQMCEPTTYRRPDGVYVRFYRDDGPSDHLYSHCLYASLSRDNGASWTKPVRTNFPDTPSLSFAGNLPDGCCLLIGNQAAPPFHGKREHKHYKRDPLVLSISRDGIQFDFAAAIRAGAPELRKKGPGKGVGFQYPSAAIVGDNLWVIYSVGKEDVGISCVPLRVLGE